MNFLAIFFIISTFYYLFNLSHLERSLEQRIVMYSDKKWIITDIIYYLHSLFYWIWLLILLFTHFKIWAIILLNYSLSTSILRWIFGIRNKKFEQIISLVKIGLLIGFIIIPFF